MIQTVTMMKRNMRRLSATLTLMVPASPAIPFSLGLHPVFLLLTSTSKTVDTLYIGPSSEAIACVTRQRLEMLANMEWASKIRLAGEYNEFEWATKWAVLLHPNFNFFSFFRVLRTLHWS